MIVITLLMGAYLKCLNKQQEKRRVAAGEVGPVVDTSIMTLEEAEAYKRSQAVGVNESGGVVAENKHAFEDLTDFQVSISRLSWTVVICTFADLGVEQRLHLCSVTNFPLLPSPSMLFGIFLSFHCP
jgi:hypothetical protein